MIIELPMPAVLELSGVAPIPLPDVSKFICDRNVSLIDLTVTTSHKGPRKARTLELLLRGAIRVTESVDRRTDLAVRIRNEERVYSAQSLRNHETEEGRSTGFRMALPVEDEAGFLSAIGSEDPPMFEITVTVRDDG